jgi:hypothetical protein
MPALFQTSFAAGELSTSLFARVDLAKYKVGAATLRNFFIDYRGGASSRPGTRLVARSLTSASGPPPRLIRFQFSNLQTYVLEFGGGYIAFYKNGAPVTSGASVYTIASPYALADLPLLKFTQSADVMTLVHPSYAPRQLNRFSDTNWTLTTISFVPVQQPPSGGTATPTHGTEVVGTTGDAESTIYTYCVTAVALTGEESEASVSFANTAGCRIMSVDGNSYVSLSWTAPAGTAPAFYQIYRTMEVPNSVTPAGAVFGLIGSATLTSYVDRDGIPDFTASPPMGRDPFADGNNPGVTTYFSQRQWFASSASKPETIWASKIGSFANMDVAQIVQASDAITATIASTQVNAIKHMVPMSSGIVVLSSGGAWLVSGGTVGQGGVPGPITPSALVAQPQAYNGCSDLPPIVVNVDVLFVQAKGSIVRDLSWNLYASVYTGTDMTVLSNHLFAGRTLREWAWAEEPYKIIWAVRDDGILLGFTYMKEQEVYAWTRHDTKGLFQSVCTVSEGAVDATYFVVLRFLNGAWVYCVERMADRSLIDGNAALGIPASIENAWCVDCGLALAQPAPAASLSIGGGANVAGASVTFTADAPVFSTGVGAGTAGGDVGSVIRANGGHATITAYHGTGSVQGTVTVPFPVLPNDPTKAPLRGVQGGWTMTAPVTVVTGLDHLDGQTVSILADGNVMAPQVVQNGAVTLQQAATSVIVGLPFQCQLETLNVDVGDGGPGGSVQGRQKKLGAVTIRVKDTRGLKAGRTPATVVPVKEWSTNVSMGGPLPLASGDQRVIMDPLFEQNGRMWLQLDDPVPATVLGCVLEVDLGG